MGFFEFITKERKTSDVLPITAAVLCFIFGILLILNVHMKCDGGWYLYAREYLDGKKLYSDLGLILQPLYILITALNVKLFGPGWLVSKIPAVLSLLLFIIPMFIIARSTKRSHVEQALLIFCTFFTGIHFEGFRFDDYHVVEYDIYLWSCVVLLNILKADISKSRFIPSILLGILTGLATVNRINDGLILTFTAVILVYAFTPTKKVSTAASMLATSACVSLLIIAATGDHLSEWFNRSIVYAAGVKGGSSNLFAIPLKLFWISLISIFEIPYLISLVLTITILLISLLIFREWNISSGNTLLIRLGLLLISLSLLVLLPIYKYPILPFSALLVILMYFSLPYLLLLLFCVSTRKTNIDTTRSSMLILFLPIAAWFSGATSSGGAFHGLCFPFAFSLLLVTYSLSTYLTPYKVKILFFTLLAVFSITGALYRIFVPCSWHNYYSRPLFMDRVMVSHEQYGPMIIDEMQLEFITPFCETIQQSGRAELLSLPYSYANYFCNIKPWNNYIQTFFDTSSDEVISNLLNNLNSQPPAWILYQRQPSNLALHENTYNDGKQLPHRKLDEFILEHLRNNRWRVVLRYLDGLSNEWLLIDTISTASPAKHPLPLQ